MYQQSTNDADTTRKITIHIYLVTNNLSKKKQILFKRDILDVKNGWVNFKIHKTEKWVQTNNQGNIKIDLLLQVSCSNCNLKLDDATTMPLLDITKEIIINKRQRRSVKCSGRSRDCCLDSFYVEFKEVMGDFGKYIVWPKGIDIGHCRGACDSGRQIAREHSAIMHAAKSKLSQPISLCCAPLKYKTTTVLYADVNGAVVKKPLHDLIVKDCGCA